jgi:tyrosinase
MREILKLPKWLFAITCNRKEQGSLTAVERQRFLCAFNMINANGTLGNLVKIHSEPHNMHHTQRFLPWHRVYLLAIEEALHNIHPDVCLPYWDWTQASGQNFPAWLSPVLPTVVTPTTTVHVVRAPQSSANLASIAANTPTALAQTTFNNFTSTIEGVHDSIHVWVGGSMAVIATAPADPIFWMHHANIDRLWWLWQNSPQGTGKNPSLSGSAAIMDPYPTLEQGTRDIIAMGYNYV